MSEQHLVAVVGAGPAGIYGHAQTCRSGPSRRSCSIAISNRAAWPNTASYVDKEKMKTGLRKQFKKILADPKVFYLGHVTVGQNQALTLNDLKNDRFRRHRRNRRRAGHKEIRHRRRRYASACITRRTSSITIILCRRLARGLSRSAGGSRLSAWATSWSISPIGCSISKRSIRLSSSRAADRSKRPMTTTSSNISTCISTMPI